MKMSQLLRYTILPVILLGLVTLTQAQAPKIGYVNSVTLLQDIPEVKQANANLEALQKQLQKKAEGMITEFQKKYQDLQRSEQNGELSPKQLEEEGTKLQQEEQNIQKFQQDMQTQIMEKRETLLQPIFDKVNSKIAEVAKENGYTYIMEDSGVLLYKDESFDVTALVKAKLEL